MKVPEENKCLRCLNTCVCRRLRACLFLCAIVFVCVSQVYITKVFQEAPKRKCSTQQQNDVCRLCLSPSRLHCSWVTGVLLARVRQADRQTDSHTEGQTDPLLYRQMGRWKGRGPQTALACGLERDPPRDLLCRTQSLSPMDCQQMQDSPASPILLKGTCMTCTCTEVHVRRSQ